MTAFYLGRRPSPPSGNPQQRPSEIPFCIPQVFVCDERLRILCLEMWICTESITKKVALVNRFHYICLAIPTLRWFKSCKLSARLGWPGRGTYCSEAKFHLTFGVIFIARANWSGNSWPCRVREWPTFGAINRPIKFRPGSFGLKVVWDSVNSWFFSDSGPLHSRFYDHLPWPTPDRVIVKDSILFLIVRLSRNLIEVGRVPRAHRTVYAFLILLLGEAWLCPCER